MSLKIRAVEHLPRRNPPCEPTQKCLYLSGCCKKLKITLRLMFSCFQYGLKGLKEDGNLKIVPFHKKIYISISTHISRFIPILIYTTFNLIYSLTAKVFVFQINNKIFHWVWNVQFFLLTYEAQHNKITYLTICQI